MLGKLFKYEWKAVSKMNALLILIAAGITALGVIYFQTPMWKNLLEDGMTPMSGPLIVLWAVIGIGGAIAYILVLVGVTYGQMIYLGVRYYRSMFSDEGYLTNTLPVKPVQLLIAKVVTAGCWSLILNFLLIVFILILVFAAISGITPVTFGDIWEALLDSLAEIFQSSETTATALFYLAVGILSPFLGIAVLFGSLSLGHYSGKNKGLMGILAYLGVSLVLAITVVMCNLVLESAISSNGLFGHWIQVNGRNLCKFAVNVPAAAGLMIWAHAILKNRLNLD